MFAWIALTCAVQVFQRERFQRWPTQAVAEQAESGLKTKPEVQAVNALIEDFKATLASQETGSTVNFGDVFWFLIPSAQHPLRFYP